MDPTIARPRRPVARTQAILDPRVWGVHPLGRETTGAIQATFALARAVGAVTVWVHSRDRLDALTSRHFAAENEPVRSWDVTFPDLPRGTYDVIVDVPDRGGHESWTAHVEV